MTSENPMAGYGTHLRRGRDELVAEVTGCREVLISAKALLHELRHGRHSEETIAVKISGVIAAIDAVLKGGKT